MTGRQAFICVLAAIAAIMLLQLVAFYWGINGRAMAASSALIAALAAGAAGFTIKKVWGG